MNTQDHNSFALPSRDQGIIRVLLIAAFAVILNETLLNVALPRLMAEMHLEAHTVQWLATAFMLTMAVVIPTTGFILQRFTTRTVFIAAMGLFSTGTLVAGLSGSFWLLLVGRIIQASGTALMLPLLITTILSLVPTEQRGRVMGRVSIVISVAPALGPTLSGLILEVLPWRFLFLFMLPIALLTLAYGVRHLKNVGEVRPVALDLFSVLLSALGFGGLVYGFSSAGEMGGWSNPKVLLALLICAISLLIFVLRQWVLIRRDAVLLDLRAFGFPMFSLGVVIIMIAMMALFGGAILLPIYLQNLRGLSSLQIGLFLLPGGLLMGLAAPTVGRLFDRYGPLWLSLAGATLLTLTLWGFTGVNPTSPIPVLLVLHLLLSLGLALLFTPLMTNAMNALPGHLYSHGSALMSTLQMVAGAIGTALLVTVMTNRMAAGSFASPQVAQTAGLQAAFALATGIAAVALLLSAFLKRPTQQYPTEPSMGKAQAASD